MVKPTASQDRRPLLVAATLSLLAGLLLLTYMIARQVGVAPAPLDLITTVLSSDRLLRSVVAAGAVVAVGCVVLWRWMGTSGRR